MKQLIVISHDTYASGLTPGSGDLDDLGSLAVGAIALIDKDPESTTFDIVANIAATSEVDTPRKFQFVTMTANGLKFSPIFSRLNTDATYQVKIDKQSKVMNINVALGTFDIGDVAGFTVTDLTKADYDLTRNRAYTRTIVAGDTEATIFAALIASVNADTLRCVTASSGTDIVLTGLTAGANFQISPIGIFTGTYSQTTPVIKGTGYGADLILYEKEASIERGNANYRTDGDLFYSEVSEVVSASQYNTYTIKSYVEGQRPIIVNENPVQELVIACLSSLSASGDGKTREGMDNFLADVNAL